MDTLFPIPAQPSEGPPFGAAVVDFPWLEIGGGGRGAQNHYQLADVKDGPRIIVGSGLWRFRPSAHLYLWTTRKFLVNGDATWLCRELGFEPVTEYVWVKDHNSLGQYGLGLHESIVFGVRGSGQSPAVYVEDRSIKSVFHWPVPRDESGRRIHSRKPPQAYTELYQARSKGPYLEMFGRGQRFGPGWTIWGNEAVTEPTGAVEATRRP